jgi:HSP20 family protein
VQNFAPNLARLPDKGGKISSKSQRFLPTFASLEPRPRHYSYLFSWEVSLRQPSLCFYARLSGLDVGEIYFCRVRSGVRCILLPVDLLRCVYKDRSFCYCSLLLSRHKQTLLYHKIPHTERIMPSVNYYNRSAPFWDWVANLEEQGNSHPMFGNRGENAQNGENNNTNEGPNPWAQGWGGFPFGPFPHRGRHGYGHPWAHHAAPQQPPAENEAPAEDKQEGEAGPSEARDPPPPFTEQAQEGPSGRCGPQSSRGRGCGGRGRGAWGARGRGPHGPPPFPPMMGGFGALANMFQDQLFGQDANKDKEEDFKPEADVFDTAESFVVHISLPGAKKEDVGVNWDAEKSELSIAGVVYRPGDEEFLKTLAMNERKVGAFERKIRLGSRANPAQVDVDGISARMEDGVLTVEVPKLDSGYVEIKKVDIE